MPACRFEIDARPDSETLPRLINYFAQRGLTPSVVEAKVDGSTMRVLIEHNTLDPAHALVIAEKMKTSCLVEDLTLHVEAAGCVNDQNCGV